MGNIVDISSVFLELGLSSTCTDTERAICEAALRKAEGAVRRHLQYDPVKRSRTEFYPQSNHAMNSTGHVWEANATQAYARQVSESASTELQVQHIPIRSDTAIELYIDYDGRSGSKATSFPASSQKTEGTDYWANYQGNDDNGNALCRDGILRSIGLWPSEAGAVKIIYTAGYTVAELQGEGILVDASPIWESVLDEAVRRAKKVFLQMKSTAVGWIAGPVVSENLGDYSYSIDAAMATKLVGPNADLTTDAKERLESFVNWGYSLGGV